MESCKRDVIRFGFFDSMDSLEQIHQDIHILLVLEGRMKLSVEEQSFDMEKDDFFVINADRNYSLNADDGFLGAYFAIDGEMLQSVLKTSHIIVWCNNMEYKNASLDEMCRLMHQILNLYYNQDGHTRLYLRSLYYALVYRLVTEYVVYDGQRNESRDESIGQIVSYIQTNYQKQISLQDLSEEMHFSTGYLSKYIKKQLHMGFHEYVNSVRLSHAVEDLLYTGKSVTRIIYDNGFPNNAAFIKLFQKKYGMTPSAYRKEKRSRTENKKEADLQEAAPQQIAPERIRQYLGGGNTLFHASSNAVKLSMDLQATAEHMDRNWQVINIGEMKELLDSRMQEHVMVLTSELKFTHVRLSNIFQSKEDYWSDDTAEKYNFYYIDRALDFLVSNGIYPYLELGYKPRNIHQDAYHDVLSRDEGIRYMQMDKYLGLIRQFAAHIVNRYGINEIEHWFFELWLPWETDSEEKYADQNYYDVFDNIYLILKQYSPRIRFGGYGVLLEMKRMNNVQILRQWGERKIKPDFVSMYCYPYINKEGIGRPYPARSADQNYIQHQVTELRKLLDQFGMEECRIHVTQFSSTLSDRNSLNDGCFKGAYVMKNLLACIGKADVMAYWYGSDLSGIFADTKSICFGANGLMTINGCKKPAFYSIQFMNGMYQNLLGKNDYAAATYNGKDKFVIVCHNYKHYSYRFYFQDENKMSELPQSEIFENDDSICLEFWFAHVANGCYHVKTEYVNSHGGSVQDELKQLGDEASVGKPELDYIKRMSVPHINLKTIYVQDEILKWETSLLPNEIQKITIEYYYGAE